MPDTIESDFISEPAAAALAHPGAIPSHQEDDGKMDFKVTIPDLMPLLDVAEGRIDFMMNVSESALHSAMFITAAGLECGTIWTRGWREINAHAATTAWRTSQMSVGASSDFMDRWMDMQVQTLDATAARLAEAA